MSQESAFQYLELEGEHRVMREIAEVLIHVCVDIYLVFCSLRNVPRYRHILDYVFAMASFAELWLENLCDVIDNASFLAILYDGLIGTSTANSKGVKRYIDACFKRTQSQRLLYQTIRMNIWDLALVLDQFNRRMDPLAYLVKESPEGAKIAARIESLNGNIDRLLSLTGQLLYRLPQQNCSFEAHLGKYLLNPSINSSDSEIQLIRARCYDSSLDLVALRDELKEQQLVARWNLDRLSSPFEPTEVRASDYFDVLRDTEFLKGWKKGGIFAFSSGRVAKLKQWFARVAGTRNIATINI